MENPLRPSPSLGIPAAASPRPGRFRHAAPLGGWALALAASLALFAGPCRAEPSWGYFSDQEVARWNDWLRGHDAVEGSIRIGRFQIPLPPGRWVPLPAGAGVGSMAIDQQIGLSMQPAQSPGSSEPPEVMLDISASQVLGFKKPPQVCQKGGIDEAVGQVLEQGIENADSGWLACHTLNLLKAPGRWVLWLAVLYATDHDHVAVNFAKPLQAHGDANLKDVVDQERKAIDAFKTEAAAYRQRLDAQLARHFKSDASADPPATTDGKAAPPFIIHARYTLQAVDRVARRLTLRSGDLSFQIAVRPGLSMADLREGDLLDVGLSVFKLRQWYPPDTPPASRPGLQAISGGSVDNLLLDEPYRLQEVDTARQRVRLQDGCGRSSWLAADLYRPPPPSELGRPMRIVLGAFQIASIQVLTDNGPTPCNTP